MRNVEINLTKNTAKIEFSTEGSDDWINVKLSFVDVIEFNIKSRAPHDLDVISGGIEYDIYNGIHYFNFDIYSSEGEGILKYKSSFLYFACKDFSFGIEEYNED